MSFLFDEETIRRNHDRTIREECREEFLKERSLSARKMLLNGKLSVEEIAEYQNLTVEEVRRLKAEFFQNV